MKKVGLLIIGLGLFTGLSSCKDDPAAETFSATPYSFQMPSGLPPAGLPADNPLTVEGVALGRQLFYDKLLSGNGTQSCASCHLQSHAFTDKGLAKSIGIRNLPGNRNSMPIFNLMLHNNGFFWDGRANTLREQSLHPIQDTLEMDETLDHVVQKLKGTSIYPEYFKKAFGTDEITAFKISLALEQFMHTLISGNSRFDQAQAGLVVLTPSEQRGQKLFFTEFTPGAPEKGADCFHCHGGPDFSNHLFMNNGLDKIGADPGRFGVTGRSQDYARFKTPSLRNVEITGPYMHDGRFKTLEEVIEHYNSGIKDAANLDPNMHAIQDGLNLTADEKTDLINFLKTLTDSTYLLNPDYAAPQ